MAVEVGYLQPPAGPCPGHPHRPPCHHAHGCMWRGKTALSMKRCCALFSSLCFYIHLPSPQRSLSFFPLCPRRPIFAGESHVPARSHQLEGACAACPCRGCSNIMISSCIPALILWERSQRCSVQGCVCPKDAGLIRGGMGEWEMHLPEILVLCASFFPAL